MAHMNFEPQVCSSSVLNTINWAAADEDYTPRTFATVLSFMQLTTRQPLVATVLPTEPTGGEFHSEKERSKLRKRKATASVLSNLREELFSGEFDG
jgi:tRNA (adenine-N(1)-)-methyltransferase non-catalytic subunit